MIRVVAVLLAGILPLSVRADVLRVLPGGPFTTIAAAVAAAADGDIVQVEGGIWNESGIVIDRSISLCGIGGPVIDGGGEEVLVITADDVAVEGFTIRGVETHYLEDRTAIRVRRAERFTIHRNRIEDCFFGIYLEHAHHGVVSENEVVGAAVVEASSGNAIHAWYSGSVEIVGNTVTGHRDGIYLEFVDGSVVHDNTSEANLRYGLHFMFSDDDAYHDNVFRDNGAGVAVMFSRNISMRDNVFEKNWGKASYGLLLKEINDAEITGNRFEQNTTAIYVEGSNRVHYARNEFLSNGWAIRISGGCLDNRVVDNDFVENTFDLAIHSAPMYNEVRGNYWSSYSGYDLDRDGVGDVPHRPVKLFNHVVDRTPEAVVLLRSPFVDLLNFSEKVSPSMTPATLTDDAPRMRRYARENPPS